MQAANARTDAAGREASSSIGVLVLAGGLGTRLRSVVSDRPKVLAEVCGRPFLAFLLDQLATAGFQDAVLCSGFRAADLEAALGAQCAGLSLSYSVEPRPLGTGGALRHALAMRPEPTWLVLNGDSICDVDLPGFCRAHAQAGLAGSLVLAQVEDCGRFGRVEFDAQHRIQQFGEKSGGAAAGWINAGVYLLSRRLIESLPPGEAVSLERACFPAWLRAGLHAYPCAGRFLDIGTPDSYRRAEAFLADWNPAVAS